MVACSHHLAQAGFPRIDRIARGVARRERGHAGVGAFESGLSEQPAQRIGACHSARVAVPGQDAIGEFRSPELEQPGAPLPVAREVDEFRSEAFLATTPVPGPSGLERIAPDIDDARAGQHRGGGAQQ